MRGRHGMLPQEECRARDGERNCGWLLVGFYHTNTHSYTLSLPQVSLSLHVLNVCAWVLMCMVHMNGLCATCEGTCMICVCVLLCLSVSNDCTAVNKQKQALALMKGCCHLFCKSVTIRAPCGSGDRLFFCITLNLRVQCINLTLLGGNKGGPTNTV